MARWLVPLLLVAAALGFIPAAHAADLTITSDTTLAADVSGTVFVAADNVTLDCAGHTITSSAWAAIDITGHTGVTVKNCRVTGAQGAGIWMNGSSGNTIAGNTASGNGTGIWLFEGSSNNVVRGNDVSNNAFYGLWIQIDSNGNTIANNVANRMQYSGIFLIYVSNNTLTGNTANGNGGAAVGPLDAGQGFYLFNASHNTLDANSASGNVSDGIQLRFSNGNRITHANSSHNKGNGVGLWDNSSGNTIDSSTLNGNFDGVQVVVAPSNTVSNTTANGNFGYAVDDDFSDALTCIGNTGSDNTYGGFFSIRSTGNVYRDNVAMRNGGAPVGPLDQGEGFYLYETDQTTMTGNLAVDNVTDGFQLRGATHTLIQGNKALSNRRIGIGLFADNAGTLSTGNTITGNLARGNKVADTQDIAPAGSNTWS